MMKSARRLSLSYGLRREASIVLRDAPRLESRLEWHQGLEAIPPKTLIRLNL